MVEHNGFLRTLHSLVQNNGFLPTLYDLGDVNNNNIILESHCRMHDDFELMVYLSQYLRD
jgi:hypothetical protein